MTTTAAAAVTTATTAAAAQAPALGEFWLFIAMIFICGAALIGLVSLMFILAPVSVDAGEALADYATRKIKAWK